MTARVLSVLVLLPIVVAAVWQEWSTALIIAVAVVIALRELFAVFRHGGYLPRLPVGIATALGLTLAFYAQPLTDLNLFPPLIVFSVTGALAAEIARRDRSNGLVNWALTFAGAYYIGGLLSSYLLIRRIDAPLIGGWLSFIAIPPGTSWIFFTLAVTWLNDTGAFFAGRRFGRTPMAPQLSPKKSWEGFAGGMAASLATAMLAVPLIGLPIAVWQAALLAVVGSLCAPLGDLAESMVKRQIGIKDSGHLIPGHGGMLDRIDSMLFTGPIMYYVIILMI